MTPNAIGLFLTITMVMANAHAQTIYKSIGPDGRTIFSDKPPAGAGTETQVIRAPIRPQQSQSFSNSSTSSTGAAEVQPPQSYGATKHGAKEAVRVRKSQGEPTTGAAPDAKLKGAVSGVLGTADVVRGTLDLCTRTLPTSYKRYSGSADGWTQRNATTLSQARSVLSQAFTPSERQEIEAAIRVVSEQNFARVVNAPMASKITWCDRSIDEISKGVLDVYNNPRLTSPLINYRSR